MNVSFVRVFEISPVWVLQNEKRFSGCRSWVELPPLPEMTVRAVLNDSAQTKLRAQFDQIVSSILSEVVAAAVSGGRK